MDEEVPHRDKKFGGWLTRDTFHTILLSDSYFHKGFSSVIWRISVITLALFLLIHKYLSFIGVRKEKKRGGRSFYPLKKQKCEEATETNINQDTKIIYCSELIEKLMDSSPCIIPPGESHENPKEAVVMESREGMKTRLSNAITKELYLIVEWAKLVPGFNKLCRKDQIALLTAGGMELIVFRVIYRSIPYKEHVYMNTTTLLGREDCYNVLNKEIVDMILDVVDRLRPLAMDQVEFACLKTILLADPGKDFQYTTV